MPQSALIVDRIPHPFFNGVTRYIDELAKQADAQSNGVNLQILFWGMHLRPARWRSMQFMRRDLPARLIQLNRQWLYPLAANRPSVGLLHYPAHGVPAEWLRPDKPCLFSVHGAAAQIAPEWDIDPRRATSLRNSLSSASALPNASFVTFSDFAKDQIVEHYQLAPERISVIPHGVDHAQFRIQDQQEIRYFKRIKKLERPYLLYVGPCAQRKNVGRMVEAFALSKQRNKLPHEFVIAGRWHPHQAEVADIARSAGVSDSVRFVGPVAHEELPLLYGGADAFSFVSLYEGFGLPLLEAMACGTPVITGATSATGEIAAGAGKIVDDPTDIEEMSQAMTETLSAGERARKLRQAGLKRAAQFTWQRSAESHFALYRELMSGRAPGSAS